VSERLLVIFRFNRAVDIARRLLRRFAVWFLALLVVAVLAFIAILILVASSGSGG